MKIVRRARICVLLQGLDAFSSIQQIYKLKINKYVCFSKYWRTLTVRDVPTRKLPIHNT